MMLTTRQLQCLQGMDIAVWRRRSPRTAVATAGAGPRIRLSAGDGDWVLVTPGAVPDHRRPLLMDIAAAIGAPRCRFGQWSDNASAGTSAAEMLERGVRFVLSLGPARAAWTEDGVGLIVAEDLHELARNPYARKALWQRISGALES